VIASAGEYGAEIQLRSELLETFKERLAEKDVPIPVDEPSEEIRAGADLVGHLRKVP